MDILDAFSDFSLPTEANIFANAQSIRIVRNPGVYFLLSQQRIVYVGQSVCPASRIAVHLQEGTKEFDSYFIHVCPENELDVIEFLMIVRLDILSGLKTRRFPDLTI